MLDSKVIARSLYEMMVGIRGNLMRIRELLFDIEVWGSEEIRSADGPIFIRKLKSGRYHVCFAKNNYKVYELSKVGLIQFVKEVRR